MFSSKIDAEILDQPLDSLSFMTGYLGAESGMLEESGDDEDEDDDEEGDEEWPNLGLDALVSFPVRQGEELPGDGGDEAMSRPYLDYDLPNSELCGRSVRTRDGESQGGGAGDGKGEDQVELSRASLANDKALTSSKASHVTDEHAALVEAAGDAAVELDEGKGRDGNVVEGMDETQMLRMQLKNALERENDLRRRFEELKVEEGVGGECMGREKRGGGGGARGDTSPDRVEKQNVEVTGGCNDDDDDDDDNCETAMGENDRGVIDSLETGRGRGGHTLSLSLEGGEERATSFCIQVPSLDVGGTPPATEEDAASIEGSSKPRCDEDQGAKKEGRRDVVADGGGGGGDVGAGAAARARKGVPCKEGVGVATDKPSKGRVNRQSAAWRGSNTAKRVQGVQSHQNGKDDAGAAAEKASEKQRL